MFSPSLWFLHSLFMLMVFGRRVCIFAGVCFWTRRLFFYLEDIFPDFWRCSGRYRGGPWPLNLGIFGDFWGVGCEASTWQRSESIHNTRRTSKWILESISSEFIRHKPLYWARQYSKHAIFVVFSRLMGRVVVWLLLYGWNLLWICEWCLSDESDMVFICGWVSGTMEGGDLCISKLLDFFTKHHTYSAIHGTSTYICAQYHSYTHTLWLLSKESNTLAYFSILIPSMCWHTPYFGIIFVVFVVCETYSDDFHHFFCLSNHVSIVADVWCMCVLFCCVLCRAPGLQRGFLGVFSTFSLCCRLDPCVPCRLRHTISELGRRPP